MYCTKYLKRRFIASLCIVNLFFIFHLGICYVGYSIIDVTQLFKSQIGILQIIRQKLIVYIDLPFQVLAMLISLFWIFDIANDEVVHQNVRVLKLSMGYSCFATPFFGMMAALVSNQTVVLFLCICGPNAALQQTLHGILFLIERCMATKWSSTYEYKNMVFVDFVLIVLAWMLSTSVLIIINMEIISMFTYTMVLCGFGTFMAICAIALHRISLYEYNKPIQGLSERYQKAKNVCISRSFCVCTVIQFTGNFIITLCVILNTSVFVPSSSFVYVAHVVLRLTIWAMSISILLNFIFWKRKERDGSLQISNNPTQPSKMYRGVTGKVVPLTAETDEYFRHLKTVWST